MKAIFLDVDGVLNSDDYMNKIKDKKVIGIENDIDKELVKKIVDVANKTNSTIVLSSSWRYNTSSFRSLQQLFMTFNAYLDQTPTCGNKRGIEIKKYLRKHPFIKDYVILDDEVFDSFDDELMKHFIKIGTSNGINGLGEGLQDKDIEEIILRLGKNIEKDIEER